MAVPKKRVSITRRRKKLASPYVRFELPQIVRCSKCNNFKRSHCICESCGYYRDKQILVRSNKS